MRPGTKLKFKEVKEAGDESLRFILLEDRGERLAVTDTESYKTMLITPVFVYGTDELVEDEVQS